MCRQEYVPCLNRNCDGFARTLALIPCENRPNCELQYIRRRQNLASTEAYCPNCRGLSKRERRNQMRRAWMASRKNAGAGSSKSQDGKTYGAKDGNAGAGFKQQQAESSRMGKRRGGVAGGGFFPDSNDPSSTPKETAVTNESKDCSSVTEEDRFLRSNLGTVSRNSRPTDLGSGSDQSMEDAPADEEDPSTSSFPDVTHSPQEANPGAVAPATNEAPRFPVPNSFAARASQQILHYRPTDTMLILVPPPQPIDSATPEPEHHLPAIHSSTPTEMIAEPDVPRTINVLSRPPAYDYVAIPRATALSDRPITSLPMTPGPSYQTAATHPPTLPQDMFWHRFSPGHPPSPQIPIDPALLQMEPPTVPNAFEPTGNIEDLERILRDIGVWPESPDNASKNDEH